MFNVGQKVKILKGKHKNTEGKITSHLPFSDRHPKCKNMKHYSVLTKGNGTIIGLYDQQLKSL